MRDIDTFNQTNMLESAKICIKWPVELILAQLPYRRVFAYFKKINKNCSFS